ncbi:MAG: SPOR domain-containing protein [Bacteroidales bacterium]|nr:SPOR domain-containing protein [Bacteroidales bacterium]
MKKLLSILLVISLIFTLGCKDNDDNNTNNQNNADTTLYPGYEEFTVNNDQNENLQDSTKIEIIANNPVVNDNVMVEDEQGNPVPATNDDLGDQSKNFYIVVGSYKKEENAQQRKEYFKKQGYAAEVLPKFGSYNRVSVASFNDETSARNELKALRSKYKDPSFWLLYR